MKKKDSGKEEARKKINEFFSVGKNDCPRKMKKVKKLAMAHNIKLGRLRGNFCKACYSVFNSSNCETRIKNGAKIKRCLKCGCVNRIRINPKTS